MTKNDSVRDMVEHPEQFFYFVIIFSGMEEIIARTGLFRLSNTAFVWSTGYLVATLFVINLVYMFPDSKKKLVFKTLEGKRSWKTWMHLPVLTSCVVIAAGCYNIIFRITEFEWSFLWFVLSLSAGGWLGTWIHNRFHPWPETSSKKDCV